MCVKRSVFCVSNMEKVNVVTVELCWVLYCLIRFIKGTLTWITGGSKNVITGRGVNLVACVAFWYLVVGGP